MEILSKSQILLTAFEHTFYVPAFSILAYNFVFFHFGVSAQNADPFFGVGTIRKVNELDGYAFYDLVFLFGIMPAYHMNKMHWVTVLLNGTVPEKRVLELIDMSFLATASAKKKEKVRPPKEWIIPSNPKYYDIIHAFDETDTVDWKQGAGIKMGDTVFMYVGAPVSAVLYKCKVTETNIPYQYQDKNLTISALMKIRLLKRYAPEQFTFEVLKSEYGIYAIRGPRGVPNSLSSALKG